MDIRQLQYFLVIAEEGQITAAARKLRMAQPPLSRQLKLLEDELGVQLLERGPRSVQLTEAGTLLMSRARQIVDLMESTVREIADADKGVRGTLALGTVSSSGGLLVNRRLGEFRRKYGGVKFEMHEGNTFQIINLLAKGIVEVGIVRTPFTAPGLDHRYLHEEPMTAVMKPELDWSPGKETAQIAELQGKPLIAYRRFEQLIREECIREGFEPEFFCKNDDARTTLQWADSGLGIGIVPLSALDLLPSAKLVCKKLDSKLLKTRVAAIWRKDHYLSSLARHFIESFAGPAKD